MYFVYFNTKRILFLNNKTNQQNFNFSAIVCSQLEKRGEVVCYLKIGGYQNLGYDKIGRLMITLY